MSDIKSLLREKGVGYLSVTHKIRRQLFKKEKRRIMRQHLAKKRCVLAVEMSKISQSVDILDTRLQVLNEEERAYQEFSWVARERETLSKRNLNKNIPTNSVSPVVAEKVVKTSLTVDPPVPVITHLPFAPDAIDQCSFFQKTGVCKFGVGCSKYHMYPLVSRTLIFPHFFTETGVSSSMVDGREQDVELEIDDHDLYQRYLTFYKDVYLEVRKCGRVSRFEVCANHVPHLRGNVFVEFERTEDASSCRLALNGRWYNRRLVGCEYSCVEDFDKAICERVYPYRLDRKFGKACNRGKDCNYWHVFKPPNS